MKLAQGRNGRAQLDTTPRALVPATLEGKCVKRDRHERVSNGSATIDEIQGARNPKEGESGQDFQDFSGLTGLLSRDPDRAQITHSIPVNPENPVILSNLSSG